MKILNKSNNNVVADKAKVADNFITRLVGLLSRSSLNIGEGMVFFHCNSIHSFGMRFKFDAVFLDKNDEVIHLIKKMAPWKVSKIVKSGYSVIELPAGTIDSKGINIGDVLLFVKE